jgi:hypothetical protein
MKTKHLAVAVIVLALAVSANVFGDSLTLSGTAQVLGGGTLSFSDSAWNGGWSWGGGTLTLTDGSTTLNDSITSASVLNSGTFQVNIAVTGAGGLLNLTLSPDSGLPEVGEAFTSNVDAGSLDDGSIWYFDSGSVSASDPGTVSASEPWNLPMSLVFFGIVAAMFGVLVRARVLRFAHA